MSGHWISKRRRARIYERDLFSCLYCGRALEADALTLDHYIPRICGGSNGSRNLVTCCLSCNSSRGRTSARHFAIYIAATTGQDWRAIVARLRCARRRRLP